MAFGLVQMELFLGNLSVSPVKTKEKNLEPTEFTVKYNVTSNAKLEIGGWSDNNWTAVGCYYYVEVYDKNDELLFNGIPCYCTSTVTDVTGKSCPAGTIGLYDLVEGEFYTNQGTGTFLMGDEI